MPDFLQFGFMQRAFAAGAVMAVVCPLIGVFLVPRRLSLIADTLAHVALAGVAVGLLLGSSPILGALVVTVVGALGMERLRSHGRLQGDAALAVFLSGGFALAVVLISLARGFNADLFAILFGSILTVSPSDVWLISGLGAVVVGTILLSYRRLFVITLHEDLARTSGVPVTALNLMLTLLTALTTVVAMRMVGVLLVSAMIVIPTLTGFSLGRSFRRATTVAVVTALAAVLIGLTAAYYLRLAAGGAVVLTALLLFAGVAVFRRLPGSSRARLAALVLLLALAGSSGASSAQEGECKRWREAFAAMPVRMVTVQTGAKSMAIRVKVAETSEQAAAGFQCSTAQEIQKTLILFDFGREIYSQFHMNHVPAALDIAFIKGDGNIFAILKMDPSPTALYGPMGEFRFALEARAGFYESQGIKQGESRLVVPAPR